jgi:photoprotection regulator FRP-like protein
MPSIQPPPRSVYSTMRDLHWSPKEKDIARRAFDGALHRELKVTIQEAKQKAQKINDASELWELERYLTQRRKEIDGKYEYKYSVLLLVLAGLIREGRVSLDELDGLAEDKLRCIRDHTKMVEVSRKPGRRGT